MSNCNECWGTGYWHGIGAPCSRGCGAPEVSGDGYARGFSAPAASAKKSPRKKALAYRSISVTDPFTQLVGGAATLAKVELMFQRAAQRLGGKKTVNFYLDWNEWQLDMGRDYQNDRILLDFEHRPSGVKMNTHIHVAPAVFVKFKTRYDGSVQKSRRIEIEHEQDYGEWVKTGAYGQILDPSVMVLVGDVETDSRGDKSEVTYSKLNPSGIARPSTLKRVRFRDFLQMFEPASPPSQQKSAGPQKGGLVNPFGYYADCSRKSWEVESDRADALRYALRVMPPNPMGVMIDLLTKTVW